MIPDSALDAVRHLRIEDPDPTEYDRGYNSAIERAVRELAARTVADPKPRPSRAIVPASPAHIQSLIRRYQPVTEARLAALVFPRMRASRRPDIRPTLDALRRSGKVVSVNGKWAASC